MASLNAVPVILVWKLGHCCDKSMESRRLNPSCGLGNPGRAYRFQLVC